MNIKKIRNTDILLIAESILTVITSLIITIYLLCDNKDIQANTFFSFFTSICSILFLLLIVINWAFKPIKKLKKGIPFNSLLTQRFDRIISQGHSKQLLWLGIAFLLLYIIMAGWMGTFNALELLPEEVGGLNPVSLTFMLFTDSGTLGNALKSDSHVSAGVTLFCLVISILGALIFTGLLISVFSNYFQRRVEDYLHGSIRYHLADHIIFIGYDDILPSIINQVLSKYEEPPLSVVLTNSDTEIVRKGIEPQLSSRRLFRKLIFYKGSRCLRQVMEQLYVESSREIYIIGNHREDNHDEKNIQCINHIIDIIHETTPYCKFSQRKPVYIHIEGHTRFKKSKLWWEKNLDVDIKPFNTYVDWAKLLLNGIESTSMNCKFIYPKIIDKNDSRKINIVIFGMKRFGRAIGIEALSLLPDLYQPGGKDVVSLITFICEDAKKEMDIFKVYYKDLFQQAEQQLWDFTVTRKELNHHKATNSELNISFEFINSSPFNPVLYSFLQERESQREFKLSIFACTENDTIDSNISIFLPFKEANIYVLQRYGTAYIEKIRQHSSANENILPFGMIDGGYDWNNARRMDNISVAGEMLKNGEKEFDDGEYKKALTNYIQSLNIRKLIVGEKHLETAWNYYDLGILYYKLRDFKESLLNYKKSLEIRMDICGENHPDVSNCLNQIGKLYREIAIQSKSSEEKETYFNLSLENLSKALNIRIKCYGENNDDVAASYNNIGNLYREEGNYDESYRYLAKGHNIRESLYKQQKIKLTKLMDSKHNIGRLYTCIGQFDKAELLLTEAYKIYKSELREHAPYIGMASYSLGELYYQKGDYISANNYFTEALHVYEIEYSINNPNHDFILETKKKLETTRTYTNNN